MSNQSLDLFFRACEVDGPQELSVGDGAERHVLQYPFAVVGSDPRCDVVIDDVAVGSRHCYLQAIGPKVLCVDLGADAAPRTTQACWLDRSQAVRVGGHWIGPVSDPGGVDDPCRFEFDPWGHSEYLPLLSKPLPRVALEFQVNSIKTRWRMRRAVVLVGSDPACAVRLNGPTVSRFHGALVLTGLGLWVVDLLGRVESPGKASVVVNGARVRYSRLEPGDVLQFGPFLVNVLYLPAPSRPPRPPWRGRGFADGQDSGEIELPGRDRTGTSGELTVMEIEALRHECQERLDEQSRRHLAEFKNLRDEIQTLRAQVEELRHSALLGGPRVSTGKVDGTTDLDDDATLPGAEGRTLGTASRRFRPGPPDAGAASPDGEPRPVAVEPNEGPANTGEPSDLWEPFDGGLITSGPQSPQLR